MKRLFKALPLILLCIILVPSCNDTNVAISQSNNYMPGKYLGKWRYKDGEDHKGLYFEIFKNGVSGYFLHIYDDFNEVESTVKIYYKSLNDSRGSMDFISFQGKVSDLITGYGYHTAAISYEDGQVQLKWIATDFLKAHGNTDGQAIVNFASVTTFQGLVRNNMRKDIYEKVTTLTKVESILKDCSSNSYVVKKIRTADYNTNLNEWNDWSGYFVVDETSVLFNRDALTYENEEGILRIGELRFKSAEDGYTTYSGSVLREGKFAGNAQFLIKDYYMFDLEDGSACKIHFKIWFGGTSSEPGGANEQQLWLEAYAEGSY